LSDDAINHVPDRFHKYLNYIFFVFCKIAVNSGADLHRSKNRAWGAHSRSPVIAIKIIKVMRNMFKVFVTVVDIVGMIGTRGPQMDMVAQGFTRPKSGPK